MEVVNSKGETEGLYLMAFNWADAGLSKSRFVPINEIEFSRPYKIIENQLAPFIQADEEK